MIYDANYQLHIGSLSILSKRTRANVANVSHEIPLDNVDFRIITLLAAGRNNKQISAELKSPLSTVQRRTRNILNSGSVRNTIQPNFKRLGVKKGLLHIYLKNGDIKDTAKQVSKMDGILSVSIHVGNSDLVGDFIYQDSEQLVDTISNLKHMDVVDRVLWSEEVYTVPVDSENISRSFKKLWKSNTKKV
jgi:DNA-binding Lrp family transcriptional regulator